MITSDFNMRENDARCTSERRRSIQGLGSGKRQAYVRSQTDPKKVVAICSPFHPLLQRGLESKESRRAYSTFHPPNFRNLFKMDSLRSALQPITHSLPAPVVEAGRSLITPYCYKTLILDIDPLASPECVKLAISKGLGIGIIGASSIVKVPQLLKIINSESASGISFLSYLLETGSYVISLAYNARHGFPFSTYGETALILIQNVVIAGLVLKYSGRGAGAVGAWVAGIAAAGAALAREDVVDFKTLAILQAGAGVLSVASKVPQIVTIFSQGGTGQLSAFAVSSPPL